MTHPWLTSTEGMGSICSVITVRRGTPQFEAETCRSGRCFQSLRSRSLGESCSSSTPATVASGRRARSTPTPPDRDGCSSFPDRPHDVMRSSWKTATTVPMRRCVRCCRDARRNAGLDTGQASTAMTGVARSSPPQALDTRYAHRRRWLVCTKAIRISGSRTPPQDPDPLNSPRTPIIARTDACSTGNGVGPRMDGGYGVPSFDSSRTGRLNVRPGCNSSRLDPQSLLTVVQLYWSPTREQFVTRRTPVTREATGVGTAIPRSGRVHRRRFPTDRCGG